MTLATLGAYAAVAALLTVTPGADTMLVIKNVVVKLAGAAYLVGLGIESLRTSVPVRATVADPRVAGRSWREGFLTNVLNPKVAVFYLAFLPQFVQPGDPVLTTFLLLAGIHALLGVLWLAGLTLALDGTREWIGRASVRQALERVSGAVLVALGLRLALARR